MYVSLFYWIPLFAPWVLFEATLAGAVSLLLPLGIGFIALQRSWRETAVHAFQSFHIVAAFFLLSALVGVVVHPGAVRWFGPLASVPLDQSAPVAAVAAFWSIAIARAGILLFLGFRAATGHPVVLPILGSIPSGGAAGSEKQI